MLYSSSSPYPLLSETEREKFALSYTIERTVLLSCLYRHNYLESGEYEYKPACRKVTLCWNPRSIHLNNSGNK